MWLARVSFNQIRFLASTLLVIAVGACSGRQVTYETLSPEQNIETGSSNSKPTEADALYKTGSAGLALINTPPSETMLSAFVTAIEAPPGASYRFSLLPSEGASCSNWNEFRSTEEPLKVELGSDGPKTLCVQKKEKSGTLGSPLVLNFRKKSVPDDGPEYTLSGRPSLYTNLSTAKIFLNSGDAVEYRASFVTTMLCPTLELAQWKATSTPLDLRFRYDGAWNLCIDVRDKFGNRNKLPHSHIWNRDTVYPVMEELPLPGGATQLDELIFNVKGSQVYEYQYALIAGVSQCTNVVYSVFTLATQPLKLDLKGDGLKTLCVLTRSEGGLLQQAPYVKLIQKVKLKADVKIQPIEVVRNSNGSTTVKNNIRKFVIGGQSITHYKSASLDRSDNCNNQRPPSSAAIPVSTQLEITFTPGGIKTLCVWGLAISSADSQITQETPTYIRFFNDAIDHTVVQGTNLVPYNLQQAYTTCGKCHDIFTEADYRDKAVNIAMRLRDKNHSNPMPKGGWSSAEQRAGMLLFLYSIPGYPQDLPQTLRAP